MSVFHLKPPNQTGFPLSLGIEKSIIELLSEHEQITDLILSESVRASFSKVYPGSQVTKILELLVKRVMERINRHKEVAENKPTPGPPTTGKSFGVSYANWVSDLDSSSLCLYLADYDIREAYRMYWFEDIDFVEQAIRTRSKQDNEAAVLNMEAVMYGMGGHYNGDGSGSGDGIDIDLSKGEGIDLLKGLGF